MSLTIDIGFQGLVNIKEDTPWMKLIGPANERKKVCSLGDQAKGSVLLQISGV